MDKKETRIFIVTGHYGSGKTEFAVNLAMDLLKKGERPRTAIVDLDIANPYFRSRERQGMLEEMGMQVYANAYKYDITQDLPALDAAIKAPLEDEECTVVLDVGGDDSGARVLNQFRQLLIRDDSLMLCVVNANRPETDTYEGALNHLLRIEAETGIRVQGLVSNTHMIRETTPQEILKGIELCRKLEKETEIPLMYVTVLQSLLESFCKEAGTAIEGLNIYPIELYMRPSWLDMDMNNGQHRGQ